MRQAEEIERLHEEACKRNELTYIDPETGRIVFTRVYHLKKGKCCQSGCRHCPYGFTRPSSL